MYVEDPRVHIQILQQTKEQIKKLHTETATQFVIDFL